MTTPLCLGIDPQPTRIGIALVTIEPRPVPVWAGTFPLDRPDMTRWKATRIALRRPDEVAQRLGCDVTLIGIERAVMNGPNTSLDTVWDSGGTFAIAADGALRRFDLPLTRLVEIRVNSWKFEALGKGLGNASKDRVAVWAREAARAAGWTDVQMNGLAEQDACDALGIGTGAVKRSGAAA